MLLKCCSQYCSKFGNLNSGHRTGKSQLSFQSQRRDTPENVQSIVQVNSFQRLASLYSKSFKLGFSSMWIDNFQMYKLYLEKAEEPEIKVPTSVGSRRKQGNFRKTFATSSQTMLKPFTVFADVFSRGQLFVTPWTIAHQVPLSMEFSRHEYWSGLPFPSPLTVWITTNCGKFWKRWEYQTTLTASREMCMQVKKQQLEPDMEQSIGSKLGKE